MPLRVVPTQPSRRRALGALCAFCAAGTGIARAQERKPPHHTLPEVLERQLVNTQFVAFEGRDCVAVELTDEVQARVSGAGANSPSFAVVHRGFENGTLEVDLAAQINGKGTADVRGFVGLAFHISADMSLYEAVYLRMSNGRLNRPPPAAPRIDRAIQYVAHPHLHFPVTREKSPGLYERGADVELGRWHRLRLEIDGPSLRAFVDGVPALSIDNLAYANRRGPVGLWVGEGSRALFSDFSARQS
ncbi:MAG: hypothetical protein JWN73_4016 [Betaproteobacteria bacterium]|nr:hypothetical protein [Betaproteobacteria bacterium]